ncbi:hypothetical protein QZH41_004588 [Actinostola sp. cb2023]|nr:hypothetical protein QZH41_004588 [Actinostola sp. cb2023]
MAASDVEVSSSLDQEEDPLTELTDEDLYNLVQETIHANEVLRNETSMFEKFLKRVDPKDIGIQSSAPTVQQTIETSHRGLKKRSRSRGPSLDRHLKLTAEQKCDIAQRELEELREDIQKLGDESEKILDNYKAIMEEAEIRNAEMKKSSYEFERDIMKGAVNQSYGGKPIDIEHDIYLTTTNVVCAIVYGKRYEIDDPEFLDIKDYNITSFRLLTIVNPLNTFPFLIHFPIKDSKDLDESRLKRDRLLDAKLHQHQATYQDGVIRDLTDALIKALQEAQQEEDSKVKDLITEDHVVMTMQDTFSGGLESTMTSIRWFIIYMLHYPDIQAKIHEELDDVIGRDVMPGSEDKQRLHYLQASISEAMRVASVGSITMRKACVDSTLAQGTRFPRVPPCS